MASFELGPSELHQVQKAFQECDEDKKEYLGRTDLKVAVMRLFGHKISKDEASQIILDYGSLHASGEKGLTLSEFSAAMKPKFAAVDEDETVRAAFLAFDRTCRGFLTVADVKAAFKQTCPNFAEHRVEIAFKELDRDGDGRISYKDFDFLMKFNNLD